MMMMMMTMMTMSCQIADIIKEFFVSEDFDEVERWVMESKEEEEEEDD